MSLMFVDLRFDYLAPVRSALFTLAAPIQYLVNWPVNLVNWAQSSISSHQALLAENAHLKEQLLLSQTRLLRLMSVEGENHELRALLRSSGRTDGKVLAAQLLSVSTNPGVHKLVLDKGAEAGVYEGQPVLDAFGIMGQVVALSPWTAEVLLITSRNSMVPVQNTRNGMRAIVAGSGNSTQLKLMDISSTADVRVGDVFVTSGLGQRYPVGYPVGIVVKVDPNLDEMFSDIFLKPAAHIDRSRQVLLVWPEYKPLAVETVPKATAPSGEAEGESATTEPTP